MPVLVHNASDFCALPISLANFNTRVFEASNDFDKRLPPDFRKANNEMQRRIAKWDDPAGDFVDPEIAEMPVALRQFFRDGKKFDGSPRPLDGSEFTWHHHEETGRMQLMEAKLHQKLSHSGGSSMWGDKFYLRAEKLAGGVDG